MKKSYLGHCHKHHYHHKLLSPKMWLLITLLFTAPLFSFLQAKNTSSECTISLHTKNIFCDDDLGTITVELTTGQTGTFTLDWSGNATAIPSSTYNVTSADIDPATGLFQENILTVSGLSEGNYFLQISVPNGETCLAQTIINYFDFLPPSPCRGGIYYAANDPGLCSATLEINIEESCGYNIYTGDGGANVGEDGIIVFSTNPVVCTYILIVMDLEPPTLNCPPSVSSTITDGTCSKSVSWSETATDNCGVYSIQSTCLYPNGSQAPCTSGSEFPFGTTAVTSTATDNSNNKTTCTFAVIVNDASPATLVLTGDIPDGIYHADQEIISNGNVPANGDVKFKAGQRVRLVEGFSTTLPSDFSGAIDDCQ